MRRIIASLVLATIVVSCGGDDSVTRETTDTIAPTTTTGSTDESTSVPDQPNDYSTEAFDVSEPDWTSCSDGLECAYVDVPLDYSNPDSEHISIFVAKRPANDPDKRIGSLLVNPGGPGFGGAVLAFHALRDPNIVVLGIKGGPPSIDWDELRRRAAGLERRLGLPFSRYVERLRTMNSWTRAALRIRPEA